MKAILAAILVLVAMVASVFTTAASGGKSTATCAVSPNPVYLPGYFTFSATGLTPDADYFFGFSAKPESVVHSDANGEVSVLVYTAITRVKIVVGTNTAKIWPLASGGGEGGVKASCTFQAQNDVTPPTAPTNLTSRKLTSGAVRLTWTESTDDSGFVNGYYIERCAGVGCTNFGQIAFWGGSYYDDTTVSPGTTYSYRIRARDAADLRSPYSNTTTITT